MPAGGSDLKADPHQLPREFREGAATQQNRCHAHRRHLVLHGKAGPRRRLDRRGFFGGDAGLAGFLRTAC